MMEGEGGSEGGSEGLRILGGDVGLGWGACLGERGVDIGWEVGWGGVGWDGIGDGEGGRGAMCI